MQSANHGGSTSRGAMAVASVAAADIETFSHMVIEEFLMNKNMTSTLAEFRREWDRPSDDVSIPSWYNVALKLQMPELVSFVGENGNSQNSVLQNLVKALAQESSIRSRRPMELTTQGLVTMPRPTALPDSSEPQGPFPSNITRQTQSADRKDRKKAPTPGPAIIANGPGHLDTSHAAAMSRGNKVTARQSSKLDQVMQKIVSDTSSLIPSKLVPIAPTDKYAPKQNKTSVENWVPDNVRMMQRRRDLKVAHQNIDDSIMLELDTKRALKGVNVTPYDKALKEEELGVTKKVPCACCLQKYLYVNLPLKVSEKAIIDIRVKWTGGMTSQTVWTDTLKAIVADTFEVNSSGSILDADASSSQIVSSNKPRGKMVAKKKVPEITPIKVYSDVRVCLFCSQFFQIQEKYRPSFGDMVMAEKRAARREHLAREKEYWDPLKMVEKDREREEATNFSKTADSDRIHTAPIIEEE